MRRKWIFFIPAALIALALFTFIGGEIVRVLWNWLLPDLFGVRTVTFGQALGLLVLCRILVGGFGMHGGRRYGPGGRTPLGDRIADRVAERMAERWDHLPPEDRERWVQRMRDRGTIPPH